MIEVEAKQIGFYGNRRRYPVGHAKHESFLVNKVDGEWMRVVEKKEKPNFVELNQDGAKASSAPQDDAAEASIPLIRMKKDDLISIAVERRLSENVDLTQLNRNQLIGLIQESGQPEDGAEATQ